MWQRSRRPPHKGNAFPVPRQPECRHDRSQGLQKQHEEGLGGQANPGSRARSVILPQQSAIAAALPQHAAPKLPQQPRHPTTPAPQSVPQAAQREPPPRTSALPELAVVNFKYSQRKASGTREELQSFEWKLDRHVVRWQHKSNQSQ